MPSTKAAFTLAEVLITLGIIGVVAAMTMPTLVQKQQEKATVTQLKKFYSVMSSAYLRAKNDNGDLASWGLSVSATDTVENEETILNSNQSLDKFIDIMSPYLKVISKCYHSDSSCEKYKARNLAGTIDNIDSYAKRIVLADGTVIGNIFINYAECIGNWGDGALKHFCGSFKIDLNGDKEPNTYGKDIFEFMITKDAIVPAGTASSTSSAYNFDTLCLDHSYRMGGIGCTAWVIYNENMDYLKCTDLSWEGKTKCKY